MKDSLKFIKAHVQDRVAEDKRVVDVAATATEAAKKQEKTGSQQQQQQPQQHQAPQAPAQVKQEPVDPLPHQMPTRYCSVMFDQKT